MVLYILKIEQIARSNKACQRTASKATEIASSGGTRKQAFDALFMMRSLVLNYFDDVEHSGVLNIFQQKMVSELYQPSLLYDSIINHSFLQNIRNASRYTVHIPNFYFKNIAPKTVFCLEH